jgi:DNA polymerase-3 subunit delta'
MTNWGIIGHTAAVDYLRRSIRNGRGAHAYLFAGPAHIGKALLALRLAQRLVCERGGSDPCLECRACKRVVNNNHPDVRSVSLQTQHAAAKTDAAPGKELKIDTIRDWQRDIDLRPFEATQRVFIMDDAETLNESASNALLKTLEEPPSYAVLILIAHGGGDLLPTIVSRCRTVRLGPLPRATVADALRQRNIAADDADLVAAWSDGRIGWALDAVAQPDLLEQQQQRLETLVQLGAASRVERMRWAEERAKEYRSDAQAALDWLRLWQSWWRDVLLHQAGNGSVTTHIDRRDDALEVANVTALPQVQQFLHTLSAAPTQLADNVNPQLVFEHVVLHVPE